jgi:hypothetical protein
MDRHSTPRIAAEICRDASLTADFDFHLAGLGIESSDR